MDILLLLVLIVLVILFYSQNKQQLDRTEHHFYEIKKEIAKIKDQQVTQAPVKEEPKTYSAPIPPVVKPAEPPKPVVPEPTLIIEEEVIEEEPEEIVLAEPAAPAQTFFDRNPPPPSAPPKPTFFERNPDLEKFIGENLINKIGIAILVLGIGFFVKYAIDQDWIGEYGRAGIGILCGGILLGFAHYLRIRFKAFSSVLVGGGISVLYFTIAIAFHEYHLISQTAAFAIMVVITGFAVMLSLTYNRIELAVLSMIGGFCTPFMVSTGEGNYIILFSYLMILNVGMLALAYFKKWNLVNILSYVFTILIYGGWLLEQAGAFR